MMRRLQERAAEIARAKQWREIARIAETLRGHLRGDKVEEGASAVVLTGQRLTRRWLIDPALRFIAEVRA